MKRVLDVIHGGIALAAIPFAGVLVVLWKAGDAIEEYGDRVERRRLLSKYPKTIRALEPHWYRVTVSELGLGRRGRLVLDAMYQDGLVLRYTTDPLEPAYLLTAKGRRMLDTV